MLRSAAKNHAGVAVVTDPADDHEFVATDARDECLGTEDLGEYVSHPGERGVAGTVPEGVVDVFEVVDVDQHHAARLTGDRVHHGLGVETCQMVDEATPVGDAGQRIAQ